MQLQVYKLVIEPLIPVSSQSTSSHHSISIRKYCFSSTCRRHIHKPHHTNPPSSVMHFLLLGATGRTGKYVVSELLSQNHTAVALVRDASKVSSQPGLTVVTGSPLSKDDIRRALTAAPGLIPSAAIMTLNTVRKSDSPFAAQVSPPRFLADSCDNACEVLKDAGIKRIVVMSTAGVGDSWSKLPWV